MAFLGKALAQHLSDELDIDIDDITKALESFHIGDKEKNGKKSLTSSKVENGKKKLVTPKTETVNKKAASKSVTSAPNKKAVIQTTLVPDKKVLSTTAKKTVSTKKDAGDIHTCEHLKPKQKVICGKTARNFIEQENGNKAWFCGTEKSGCYATELKAKTKKEMEITSVIKTNAKTTPKPKGAQKGTNADRNLESEKRSKSLIDTVAYHRSFNVVSHKTADGKSVHIEKKLRALVDKTTDEFYGILDEDDKTILPLTKEVIRTIEGNGCHIRHETNKTAYTKRDKTLTNNNISTSTAISTKESEDEESENEDENKKGKGGEEDDESEEAADDDGEEDEDGEEEDDDEDIVLADSEDESDE